MSTLERADEIERDFYYLKSIEWACSQEEAKQLITVALAYRKEAIQLAVADVNALPERLCR